MAACTSLSTHNLAHHRCEFRKRTSINKDVAKETKINTPCNNRSFIRTRGQKANVINRPFTNSSGLHNAVIICIHQAAQTIYERNRSRSNSVRRTMTTSPPQHIRLWQEHGATDVVISFNFLVRISTGKRAVQMHGPVHANDRTQSHALCAVKSNRLLASRPAGITTTRQPER